MKNLFNMSHTELSNDFNERIGNRAPIKTGWVLVSLPYENANDSTNDILRRWIVNNGFPFINTFNGDVWFSQNGETWESAIRECSGNTVSYYTAL